MVQNHIWLCGILVPKPTLCVVDYIKLLTQPPNYTIVRQMFNQASNISSNFQPQCICAICEYKVLGQYILTIKLQ